MGEFTLDPEFLVGTEFNKRIVIAQNLSVHPFDTEEALDYGAVGGKNASLAHMFQHGLPVPDGFAVPSKVFEDAVDKDALIEATTNRDDAKAQAIARATPVPKEVFDMYDAKMPGERVAVCSSAIAEDSANASWAGRLNSFSYQSRDGGDDYFQPPDPRAGDDNFKDRGLARAIQEVWASFFAPIAMMYKEQNGDLDDIRVAVVVQQMIDPDHAGVAFSANPQNGSLDEHFVTAVHGHGENAVGGETDVDTFILDKASGRVKQIQGKFGDTLTPDELRQVHNLAHRAQEYHGYPQDIEFAVQDGKVYIVQSRDITAGIPDNTPRYPGLKGDIGKKTLPKPLEFKAW